MANTGVVDNRSDSQSVREPYFIVSADEDELHVFRHGINGRNSLEAVADSLLKSSEDWIVSKLREIQRPGFQLDLGFRPDVDLLREHSLHLYAIAVADRIKALTGAQFSSVRVVKRHGETTTLSVGEAVEAKLPASRAIVTTITRRSYATPAFGQEIQDAAQRIRGVASPNKPLRVHVSYVTGLPRTWSRLWGPTISAVFMHQSENVAAGSAQIVELGFDHRSIGEQLGHRVRLTISASRTLSEL
jgi:hypothetical protein